MKQRSVGGFALVELIICIGLIALLTAVAVPKFMEAQTSSSVARVRKDHLHISIALETYRLDTGSFPWMNALHSALWADHGTGNAPTLERLTTPVAYVSGAPFFDPFEPDKIYTNSTLEQVTTPAFYQVRAVKQYFYMARNFRSSSIWHQTGPGEERLLWFLLESSGPDKHHHYLWSALNSMTTDTLETRGFLGKTIYDPTNGTTSRGSIWRVGGNPAGNGRSMAVMVQSAKANDAH